MQTQEKDFLAVLKGGDFPMVARMFTRDIELDLDQLFEFGLGRLLDGVQRYLSQR